MTKPILHIDMDGVLVDLADAIDRLPEDVRTQYGKDVDEVPGLFDNPPPIAGAVEGLNALLDSDRFEIHVLSTAPWGNPSAWTAKRHWMERHFGDRFKKRVTLTHRKDRVAGDFLIDDRPNNGAEQFAGEWIQFGVAPFDSWEAITKYLLTDGFFWAGELGAYASPAHLRDDLIDLWLKTGHQELPLPEPLAESVIMLNRPTAQGGGYFPDAAMGPFPHPWRPTRIVGWFKRDLDLLVEEWVRVAQELGIESPEFIESETPHADVRFLNRAHRLVRDLGVEQGGGIGRFESRVRKSTRQGTASLNQGAAIPIVRGNGTASHFVDFINDETAYVFKSSGPALAGTKSLHLAHLVEGEWVLGKKLHEFIS
jgi:5'(3')-deoxyribonucleotidase